MIPSSSSEEELADTGADLIQGSRCARVLDSVPSVSTLARDCITASSFLRCVVRTRFRLMDFMVA